MRENGGKMWTKVTPNTDTFYTVHLLRESNANWFKYESYNVEFMSVHGQNNLRIFLNAIILLSLAGWCVITNFL